MKYKGYKIEYCSLCETSIISCKICTGSSCNAMSCEICHKELVGFNEWLNNNRLIDRLLTAYFKVKLFVIPAKFRNKTEEELLNKIFGKPK